jgi:ABC-type transporter Mla subunit MlaD
MTVLRSGEILMQLMGCLRLRHSIEYMSDLRQPSYNPSGYLKVTTRLEQGTEFSEIFERHSDNGKIKDEWFLSELLQDLSEHFGVDLSSADVYFSTPDNEDDPADVIQMDNLDEASIRRRLENYCLAQACSLDPYSDQVPQQYIASYRTAEEGHISPFTAENPQPTNDPSGYLKVTTRLEQGTEFSEIFDRHADNGKIKDEWFLSELLRDLSEHFGVDLSSADVYFSTPDNEDDPADVIQMDNLDEASIRRRLENYCLAQACSLDPHSEQVPQQYIASYRAAEENYMYLYTAEDPQPTNDPSGYLKLSEIFDRHADNGKIKDEGFLSELLRDLSEHFGVDLSSAYEYFSCSVNEDDPADVIQMDNLDEASFRRRLENYCQAQECSLHSDQVPQQYIASYRTAEEGYMSSYTSEDPADPPQYVEVQEETQQFVEETKQTVEDTQQGVEETKQTVEEAKQIVEETKQAVEETKQTVEKTQQAAEETKQTVEEAKQIVEETKQAVEETKQTVEETQQATDETKQSVEETKQILEETKETEEETRQTVEEMHQVGEETKEAVEETQQVVEESQQTVEEMQQTVEKTQQVVEVTKQAVEDTQQAVEETKQAIEETQQTVEETQQTVKETQHTGEKMQQKTEETKQIVEETQLTGGAEEEEFEQAMEEASIDLAEQIKEEVRQEPMTKAEQVKSTEAIKTPPDEHEDFWLDSPKPKEPAVPPPSYKRKGHQIKVKPLTYEVQEEPEEIMERKSRGLHKDEISDLTDGLDRLVQPARPETWLTPLLQKHAGRILKAFISQMTSSLDEVFRDDIGKVFDEVLTVCGVPRTQIGSNIFQSLVDQLRLDYLSHLSFLNLMEDWAAKYSPEVPEVAAKLRQTIAECEAMMQSMGSDNTASIDLAAVVLTLKSQLRQQLTQVHKQPKAPSPKDVLMKALKEIFAFYARQQKVMGAPSTFDSISHSNSIWTLSKFLIFCKDFDLMGKHGQGLRRLDREELTAIFKKQAALAKLLSEENFVEMLERLAVAFFNSLYDQESQRDPVEQLSPSDKFSLLCKYLGCDSPEGYQQKMKGFAPAFSKEKAGYRILEDDLSKKYKYRSDQRPRYHSQIRSNSRATPNQSTISPSKLDAPKTRNSPSPKKVKSEAFSLKVLSDQWAKEQDVIRALGIDEFDLHEEGQPVQDISRVSKLRQAEVKKLGQMLKMHDQRLEIGLKAVERVRRQPQGLGYK